MSGKIILDPEDTFATLCTTVGLDDRLRKALCRLGYIRPTLVQSKCLPLAISSGRDLLVKARTGSGKTLAYCLPILHKILSRKDNQIEEGDGFVKALVLAPTKELCTQISKTLNSLTYYCDEVISIAILLAGRGASSKLLAQQEAMLRDRPNVLVSTPAGLLGHIRSGGSVLESTLKISLETLVVDEADLVLSFGYTDDVTEIMKYLPKICQGFLMSATLSPELNSLKKVVLHSPAVLKLEEEELNSRKIKKGTLTQFYLELPRKDKNLVLYVFLKLGLLKGKGLFFLNTIDGGYHLKLFLEQFHIRSAVLNAELPLQSRLNIIEQFNIGNFDYLIATDESMDAAANSTEKKSSDGEIELEDHEVKKRKKDSEYCVSRGLDFRGVSFVVNVDFPLSPESYTHRIGRTARGGAKGVALSLVECNLYQSSLLRAVQRSQPQLPLAAATNDTFQAATPMGNDDGFQTDYTQSQPTPLDFDLNEIEGFRYRVEDVSRAVTKIAVRETRSSEIKAEILNSQRLLNHFKSSDLQILRHDRKTTHVSKVQDHLKNVPKYLLPRGMQVAQARKRKRRKPRNRNVGNLGQRRTDNDPLQSYDSGNIGVEGEGDVNSATGDFDDPLEGEKDKKSMNEKKLFLRSSDGSGESSSGRNAWKKRHKKGIYSRKYKKKQEQW